MIKKYILSFIIALCIFSSSAQDCDYMFDSEKTPVGIVIASEITGDIYTIPAIPVISMISPEGETLWRTEDNIGPYLNIDYITISYFDESFVYVRLQINEDHQNSTRMTQIWKIAIDTGDIIWKSQLFLSDDDENSDIQYFDDNQFLFYHGIRDNNGGTIAGYKIFLMNDSDASVVEINEFVGPLTMFKPILDQNNNLIIAFRPLGSDARARIRKINGLDFSSIIWDKTFGNGLWNTADLTDVSTMIIDKYNDFYVFGNGDLFKINVDNGAEIWNVYSVTGSNYITDHQFFDDYLYISSAHVYVGSVYTSFELSRINIVSGELDWTSYEAQMAPTGAPIPMVTGDHQALYSFDMDCAGDIYATGYYGSSNYAPGAWGIMKISGQTGAKISDITVTNNPATLNTESVGVSTYVYNGEPMFLGNLQYSSTSAVRAYVKTSADLSEVQTKVYQCIVDSDGDSIADWDEDLNGINFLDDDDTDNDGIKNYLDTDDDNDGIATIDEDTDLDGNPLNDFSDPLNPELPDYLNPNIALSVDESTVMFSVYPNPTKDLLHIVHSSGLSVEAKVFSLTGTEVYSCSDNCTSIDIAHLAAGVYFLKLTDGSLSTIRKIIKQ